MNQHTAQRSTPDVPLAVDFDGTVCLADTLAWLRARSESLGGETERGRIAAQRQSKQSEKIYLWERVGVSMTELPFDADVLDLVEGERRTGRAVVLVTGSAQGLADAAAAHLGLFDDWWGSSDEVNLTGPRKAATLTARFGRGGFDYLGDSPADLHVWLEARHGIVIRRPGSPAFEVPTHVRAVQGLLPMRPPPGHDDPLALDDSWT